MRSVYPKGNYVNDKIDTGGGAGVGGSVNTDGGNFVGRDQYNIHNYQPQLIMELSEEENDLLLAANENEGEIYQLDSQQTNKWIRVKKDYINPDDLMYAALFVEALGTLMKRGYVIFHGKALYGLTGSGFKKARELKALMQSDEQ